MLAFYHMLMFSKFNLEPETAFLMGYSMVTVTAIFTGVNMGLIGRSTYNKWIRRKAILVKKMAKKENTEQESGSILKNLMS